MEEEKEEQIEELTAEEKIKLLEANNMVLSHQNRILFLERDLPRFSGALNTIITGILKAHGKNEEYTIDPTYKIIKK